MTDEKLDEIDKGIIHLLQEDARNSLAPDMADRLPVSEGTVRNRLRRLEDRGIIEGYAPKINYEAAGYPLKIVYSCEAPIDDRADLAQDALDLSGVVNVREMLTGVHNVHVFAIAEDTEEMIRIASELTELGLDVAVEELLRHEYVQPFSHFGKEGVEENHRDGEE